MKDFINIYLCNQLILLLNAISISQMAVVLFKANDDCRHVVCTYSIIGIWS